MNPDWSQPTFFWELTLSEYYTSHKIIMILMESFQLNKIKLTRIVVSG